jgi:diguanylate cyclase (GGDEF)-like protein
MVTNGIKPCNGKLLIRPSEIPPEEKFDYRIIVVDDDPQVRTFVSEVLKRDGYDRVYTAANAGELEVLIDKTDPDLVLMDLDLGKGCREGLELMQRIDTEGKVSTNFIVMSGHNDQEILLEAFRRHAMDFLEKPLDPKNLKARVEKTLIDIEFRTMALTDSMTRVANKGTFYDYLHYHLASFLRNERPVSVVMMDVDHFKQYNDTFGHPEGDYVLKKLANFFPSRLRNADMVARYGGEEFVIVMPETPFDRAFATFGRVYWGFKEITFHPKEGVDRNVTLSAGIATLDMEVHGELFRGVDYKTFESRQGVIDHLVRASDWGLYQVKTHGRNNCYPNNCLVDYRGEPLK